MHSTNRTRSLAVVTMALIIAFNSVVSVTLLQDGVGARALTGANLYTLAALELVAVLAACAATRVQGGRRTAMNRGLMWRG